MPISKKNYLLYIGAGLFLLISVLSLLPDQVSLAESAGYALEFDGSNDYVRFASTIEMFPSGWQETKTVSLWVRPDGPGAVCIEVAHCDHIFGDFPRWWGIAGDDRRPGQDLDLESIGRYNKVNRLSLYAGRMGACRFGTQRRYTARL